MWENIPFEIDHTVWNVRFLDENTLEILCGSQGEYRFIMCGDTVTGPAMVAPMIPIQLTLPPGIDSEKLPARAGRRMLAEISAACPMEDGIWLLGSKDALFSLYNQRDGSLFSLGGVGAHGPVTRLAVSGSGKVAFGISGDPDDLGHLIRFDRKNGLIDLGRGCRDLPDQVIASNPELACIAVNSDGSACAVGAKGRLACVYWFEF